MIIGRLREARAAFRPEVRRDQRDEHALRVIVATVLRHDSNAIDVGANEGAVLSRIVTAAPDGRHIAYEPIPGLCEDLVARFPQVDVRCCALSDVPGTTEFSYVVDAPAYSGMKLRSDLPEGTGEVKKLTVPVDRLDDALEAAYTPAMLKIDVEGAEIKVLRGAAETLARHCPYVLFEHGVGGSDVYGTRSGELFDLLLDAGMRIFDLEGDGPYSRDRFEATFTEPIWNYLAAPA